MWVGAQKHPISDEWLTVASKCDANHVTHMHYVKAFMHGFKWKWIHFTQSVVFTAHSKYFHVIRKNMFYVYFFSFSFTFAIRFQFVDSLVWLWECNKKLGNEQLCDSWQSCWESIDSSINMHLTWCVHTMYGILYRSNVTSMKNWSERSLRQCRFDFKCYRFTIAFYMYMCVRFMWPIGIQFEFFHGIFVLFFLRFLDTFLVLIYSLISAVCKSHRNHQNHLQNVCVLIFPHFVERLFHFKITYSNKHSFAAVWR